MQNIGLAGDVDLRSVGSEDLFLDLDATTEAIKTNLDRLLRLISDRALSQALDTVEEYDQVTDGEAHLKVCAGLTVLYVERVRLERDRRLTATARKQD